MYQLLILYLLAAVLAVGYSSILEIPYSSTHPFESFPPFKSVKIVVSETVKLINYYIIFVVPEISYGMSLIAFSI